MSEIRTNYGRLSGVTDEASYCRGKIRSCNFEEANEIPTRYGTLVPQFREIPSGKRQKNKVNALTFYDNGQLKSIALEEATMIQTSIGNIKAEFVTFYREGDLKEVFPLNGKIDAYWTNADEEGLVEPMTLDLAFGQVVAKVQSLVYYPGGELKNVVLWEGEKVQLPVIKQNLDVRLGFTLFEDGGLRSVEPYAPTKMETSIGDLWAYDADAQGGCRDTYSLGFGKKGQVVSLTTQLSGIEVRRPNEPTINIEPKVETLESDSDMEDQQTFVLKFQDEQIIIEHGYDQYTFETQEAEIKCLGLDFHLWRKCIS